uniref:histidine kinase n=1 Tax=Thermosporothrix sp. COM3 TaxID=2490863 RepID=A0A455SQH1_9CHLR|nr:hypothetical protein KTC_44190 [Thermosporothrix sp. COM3]
MASASAWESPDASRNRTYLLPLLRFLLQQMMAQFSAQGACIALYDESQDRMVVQAHVRVRNASVYVEAGGLGLRVPRRRISMHLQKDIAPTPSGYLRQESPAMDEIEDVLPPQCELFAVGTAFARGQDVIGQAWQRNEAYILSHEEYLSIFHHGQPLKLHIDIPPTSYLVVPVQEGTPVDVLYGDEAAPSRVEGVVVLYQIISGLGAGFQQRQRAEALQYVERISLYLQNERLKRLQQRTSEYLEHLQNISTAFPATVKLSELVGKIYQFTTQVVDVSAMLLTLYDRDTEGIYDIFAVIDGHSVANLAEQPVISKKEDRPMWWTVAQQVAHNELLRLNFSPAQDARLREQYQELLMGTWGDQRSAQSFLFLPMKMFNRVTGSLCLTSKRPHAYHVEEIQVLETMIQIVTVSFENAKLYERDRHLLRDARQREAQLAAINSALQSIGSVLDVNALLNTFVEKVASLVRVDLCVFFQLSPTKEELVAQAMYGPPSVSQLDDGSGRPAIEPPYNKGEHEALIRLIRLPFQDTFLQQLVNESSFFYLDPPKLEELAQLSDEGGALFLRALPDQQMLMIPMFFQEDFIGLLSVSVPRESRNFRPKDVGMLLAICAQAASAIRNAQLVEQREEAYAELQRMDKLKDEFMVTASHELRTPMSAIIGYSTLLKRQSSRASSQDILRFATKISTAAQQLQNLIDNMTDAAKLGAVDKKLELKFEAVQVRTVAEIAARMLLFNIEQKIRLRIDKHLWVNADVLHFRQVMVNLLDNASKYSPAKSEITVFAEETTLAKVAERLPEDQEDPMLLVEQGDIPVVLISVKDQGEGVLPEDQQRIFEKFVRAPRSLTTPVRGSGLGLYICRRYVEAMGGKIWLASSDPEEGSVFTFYLPRVEPPVETGE